MADGDDINISFFSRSILRTHEFSWVFLVDWIMILLLSIFVLFYFNQLLGFIVNQTICRYLWYRHGVYVKIQSIEISLLGGRLIFRNAVYIGTSQAVRVVYGTLKWRYWLRRRIRSAYLTSSSTAGSAAERTALCLNLYGVEWFVYNREYAYEMLATKGPPTTEFAREFEDWQLGLSFVERKVVELLPLRLDAERIGVVIGNEDTESLLVLSGNSATCTADLAAPSSTYDRYMACFHARIFEPNARLKDNPDYEASSIIPEPNYRSGNNNASATNIATNSHNEPSSLRQSRKRHHTWMHKLIKKSQREPEKPWMGLRRYMDTNGESELESFDSPPDTPETSRFYQRSGLHRRGHYSSDSSSAASSSANQSTSGRDSTGTFLRATATRESRNGEPGPNNVPSTAPSTVAPSTGPEIAPSYTSSGIAPDDVGGSHNQPRMFASVSDLENPSLSENVRLPLKYSQADPKLVSKLAALPAEYAKVSQLLACETIDIKFHVDVVGGVESDRATTIGKSSSSSSQASTAENGKNHHHDHEHEHEHEHEQKPPVLEHKDPIFDVQLELTDAKIAYGPYAERQRQSFYSVFFPRNCSNAVSPEYSPSGTPCAKGFRLHPVATVGIELVGDTTLVVPVREPSKDEEFLASFTKGSSLDLEGDVRRTYGWIEICPASGSMISVTIPFLPDSKGFDTRIQVELQRPDVRSSVNHDTVFNCDFHSIVITQHVPLVWNELQTYIVEQRSENLNFFALREHATLISDMMSDFATGPPIPYALFTPSRYLVSWDVAKFALHLNVNKGNIINKPTSLSENTFLILHTQDLNLHWDVPRELITSPTVLIDTIIEAPLVEMELSAPNWHTLHGFLDSHRMARIENLRIYMHYHLTTLTNSQSSEGDAYLKTNASRLVDTQVIDISGQQFAMTAHGFLIDYIMRIRENYFGHAYHFQTTEEFLQKHTDKNQEQKFEITRTAVDTDTEMRIRVEKGCFLLPTRLYTTTECISLQFIHLSADCRFTNYYMDLQLEFTPLTGRLLHRLNPGTAHEEALRASFSNADLSVSQIEIHAHRMFGLPPSEPTYVVRWDFEIGDITADFLVDFGRAVGDAGAVFGLSFRDDENKPVLAPEELNDVTFLSVNIASVDAIMRPSSSWNSAFRAKDIGPRFRLSTSTVKIRVDDYANDRYSAKRTIEIPFVGIKGYLDSDKLVFEGHTSVYITTFVNKQHSREFYEKQQKHIALHDALFHRAPFLLDDKRRNSHLYNLKDKVPTIRPCLPLPTFDPPFTRDLLHAIDPQFVAVDERRGSDTSQHTSLESLAYSFEGADSTEDSEDDPLGVPYMARSARAESSEPNPDVYPFSSETVSAERERLRSKKGTIQLHPRHWHPNAPALAVDDEVQNISMVIQITAIEIAFTPALIALAETFSTEPKVDFEAQLDKLHIHIVRTLIREERLHEVLRTHIVTPGISVDFSEDIGSHDGVRLDIKQVDVMLKIADETKGANVSFDSLSVSLRHGSQDRIDVTRINAFSLVLSRLSFWWQQASQEDGTGSLNLDSIDASIAADSVNWAITYIGNMIYSLPRSVRRNSDIVGVGENLSQGAFGRKAVPKDGLSKQEILKATFYALTMAGERMGVEQDSYVLSRPSGAIQSRAHVRSKISWRLVMRLRYLLQRLPPAERLKMQSEIAEGTFKIPQNAREETVDVYRKWRSWEQSNSLEDEEIFKFVFDDKTFQEYVLSMSTKVLVKFESMVARVVYPDRHDHFVGLDHLQFQLVSTQKNNIQNLNIAFRCSKLRARGSIELLSVAAAIFMALASLQEEQESRRANRQSAAAAAAAAAAATPLGVPPAFASNKSASSVQNVQHIAEESAEELPAPQGTQALQASISIFLLDLIVEFELVTLRVEAQNHQIQFNAAVELMETADLESLFHTGTLITSDGAFRINYEDTSQARMGDVRNSKRDLLDSLVKDIQVGYASRGLAMNCNTWATVKVDAISFISHPTVLELVKVANDAVERDVPRVRQEVDRLVHAMRRKASLDKCHPVVHAEDIGSVSSEYMDARSNLDNEESIRSFTTAKKSELKSAGQYVNFDVASIKLRVRLLEDLRGVFHGRSLSLKLRHTDAIVSGIDVNRCTVGVQFGDGSASVANTQLELFRAVLRYDPELNAFAIFNNISAIRLETMSLAWILEYAKHRHIDAQVVEVLKEVDTIYTKLDQLSSHDEDDGKSDSLREPSLHDSASFSSSLANIRLSLVNRIHKITVRLPLDNNSFNMTIAEATLHYANFKTFNDLKAAVISPESLTAGIDDLTVELLTARKTLRELVRLKFDLIMNKEESKTLLTVDSDFIRFAFDPEAVGAIFIAVQKLKEHSQDILISRENFRQSYDSRSVDDSGGKPLVQPAQSRSFSDFESVRLSLLLKTLTVTWFTSPESSEGVVLGLEELQVRIARLAACAKLEGIYITPNRKSSAVPIRDRMNTLYLPLIHLQGFMSKDKNSKKPWLQGQITGESLALTVTPSVALWAMLLLDSFDKTGRTLEAIAQKQRPRPSSTSSSTTNVQSSGDWQLLEIPFNVRLNTFFDRAVFKLNEETLRIKEPAIELFSPTLSAALEFKDNRLALRVDASKTSNKIFPKAISELKAISSIIALSLKQRSGRYVEELGSPILKPQYTRESSSSLGFDSMSQGDFLARKSTFGQMELDIRVHLESQELYLSCLPFGKVGALLATDGLDIMVTTPRHQDDQLPYLASQMFLKRTKVSFQHMYSREVSAMVELSELTALSMYHQNDPLKVAVNLHDPKLNINLSKLHDIRIFFDIWTLFDSSAPSQAEEPDQPPAQLRQKYNPAPSSSTRYSGMSRTHPDSKGWRPSVHDLKDDVSVASDHSARRDAVENERLIDKYKRAVSSMPFSVLVNFTVSDFSAKLGMGPAIGDADLTINRFWLVVLRSESSSQMLNAGIDTILAKFNGRFGGAVKLDGILAKLALEWKETESYPLIHAKVRMRSFGFYFSLDFHPFITGDMTNLAVVLTTQDQATTVDDRIHLALSCESVSIVLTALVIAHSYDVISLFRRLQSQISSAQFFMPEIAQEAATRSVEKQKKRDARIKEYQSKSSSRCGVRILMDIHFGEFLLHAFPTEFVDSTALKVSLKRFDIHFDQRHFSTKYETRLDLAIHECLVGLAGASKGGYKGSITDLDYEDFLRYVSKSSMGSVIVNTPEVSILMDTWENSKEANTVHYTFSNDVHGSVEVGWNLGSINFIKEMINAHKDAWGVRQYVTEASSLRPEDGGPASSTQALRQATATLEREGSFSTRERSSTLQSFTDIAVEDASAVEDDSGESFPVITLMGIKYIAKRQPVILIPQLRDLGDATPPIEWLGVNRERIPVLLHYCLTRKLTQGADEAEKLYLDLIGRRE